MQTLTINERRIDISKVVLLQGRGTDKLSISLDSTEILDEVLIDNPSARECFNAVFLETEISKGYGLALAREMELEVDEIINVPS